MSMYMLPCLEQDMAGAVERIVVQTTAQDKQAIAAKAKRLDLPIPELMRRGACAYRADESDAELATVADAAKAAAERAGAAIDDALKFIDASNKRIEAMEAKAARASKRRVRFADLIQYKAQRGQDSRDAMQTLAEQAQQLRMGYEQGIAPHHCATS